jgi:hypothetical protein
LPNGPLHCAAIRAQCPPSPAPPHTKHHLDLYIEQLNNKIKKLEGENTELKNGQEKINAELLHLKKMVLEAMNNE